MKITLTVKQEFEVTFLKVRAGVRYWDDGEVNGVEDTDGNLMPCREDLDWCPIININTGQITNWTKGTTAEVHYKTCDDNDFYLLDDKQKEIVHIEGYVIDMMSPKESGFGDYIIMDIDENGFIKDFQASFDEF